MCKHTAVSGETAVSSGAVGAQSTLIRWAVMPWAFFIGENVVLSHNRTEIIAMLGNDEGAYHGLYNAVSTVACASLGFGYFFRVRASPPARTVSTLACVGGFALQLAGMAGLAQALPRVRLPVVSQPVGVESSPDAAPGRQWVARCPMEFKSDAQNVTSPDGLHGMQRVSRHPMLMSLGAVGLGSALASTSVPQAVWLLGPAVMACVGGAHIDYRRRRGIGGTLTPEEERVTSLLPFIAMASGAHQEGPLGSLHSLLAEGKAENALLGALLALRLALRRA